MNRYQVGLETSMRSSDFIFDCFHLWYYKYHQTNPNWGASDIQSVESIKNKKASINPINGDDDKNFQYGATVISNQQEIERNFQRTSEIKPSQTKYNYKGINFLSGKHD